MALLAFKPVPDNNNTLQDSGNMIEVTTCVQVDLAQHWWYD